MDDDPKNQPSDERRIRLLSRLAEMDELAEQLPEPQRAMAQKVVASIRRELQPILDALKWRH